MIDKGSIVVGTARIEGRPVVYMDVGSDASEEIHTVLLTPANVMHLVTQLHRCAQEVQDAINSN